MIEICLNPDNQMLGGEALESVDSDVHADSHSEAARHGRNTVIKPSKGWRRSEAGRRARRGSQ